MPLQRQLSKGFKMKYEELTTKGDYIEYVKQHSKYLDIDTALPMGYSDPKGALVTIYIDSYLHPIVVDIVEEAWLLSNVNEFRNAVATAKG